MNLTAVAIGFGIVALTSWMIAGMISIFAEEHVFRPSFDAAHTTVLLLHLVSAVSAVVALTASATTVL
jgi:hypothetical protein